MMTNNKDLKELYSNILRELTIYETDGDPEITTREWLKIFYALLVQTINCIDCMGEED